eukprot:747898-Hanusia_phi.AAC.4
MSQSFALRQWEGSPARAVKACPEHVGMDNRRTMTPPGLPHPAAVKGDPSRHVLTPCQQEINGETKHGRS